MRALPNPWGFCVICAEVIDSWLEVQSVKHDPNLAACLKEYQESLKLENNRQSSGRRHMSYRNRHKVSVNA